jgi:Arc/MetJ family transcription regulator
MRTNIVLDDELMREALAISQAQTKKEVIHEALRLYIRVKKRRYLSDLAGKIRFRDGYDHKKLRELRD